MSNGKAGKSGQVEPRDRSNERQATLTAVAKGVLNGVSSDHGVPYKQVLSRLICWFGTLDEDEQGRILREGKRAEGAGPGLPDRLKGFQKKVRPESAPKRRGRKPAAG